MNFKKHSEIGILVKELNWASSQQYFCLFSKPWFNDSYGPGLDIQPVRELF
jgi:hypothetical protein